MAKTGSFPNEAAPNPAEPIRQGRYTTEARK